MTTRDEAKNIILCYIKSQQGCRREVEERAKALVKYQDFQPA